MKTLNQLEKQLEHERNVCQNHGLRQRKPTTFWFAVVNKSLTLVSNIVLYPFRYVAIYFLTYIYSNINSDYVKRQMFEAQYESTPDQKPLNKIEVDQK